MKIGWLDPAMESANAGDIIISDAVELELRDLGISTLLRLPTRRSWSSSERKAASSCTLFVVGGTNLLSSHPLRYRQWSFGLRDSVHLHHRSVLMGAGWWQYQSLPDRSAKALLSWTLHPSALHSVRDSYTRNQLTHLDVQVVNTTCPTLWRVPRRGQSANHFTQTVVATVTDYLRAPGLDRAMLQGLRARAARLLIWPQGSDDSAYVSELGFGQHLIEPGLDAYHEALASSGAEYVGTRLHAGIRALQLGTAAVVIAVDNRATELGADTGLWVIERRQMASLDQQLDQFQDWNLAIPDQEIARWRDALTKAAVQ